MNFLQLQSMVTEHTGRPDKIVSVAQDAINNALKKLFRSHPWDKMRQTTTLSMNLNDITIQMPKNVHEIITTTFQDPAIPTASYPLLMYRKTTFLTMFPNVAGSVIQGRPLFGCRDDANQVILLDKKSNGSYNVTLVYSVIQKLILPTDEPIINGCDEYLIAVGTAQVYRSIQMYEDAKMWDTQAMTILRDLIIDVERETGLSVVAKEFTNVRPRSSTNPPWLDPFEGHNESISGW